MTGGQVPSNPTDSSDSDTSKKTKKDDTLIWLGPENRAVPRSQITNDLITTLQVMCTACGEQINHFDPKKVHLHSLLSVIVCKSCSKNYGDGNFQKDDTGADEYCRWCAEGGKLLVCDGCNRSFCKSCIRRNLSRKELSRVTSLDTWNCYACDPSPIMGLVNYANMIRKFSKEQQSIRPNSLAGVPEEKVSEDVQLKMMAEVTAQFQHALDEFSKAKEGQSTSSSGVDLGNAVSLMHDHALKLARITKLMKKSQRREKRTQLRKSKPEEEEKSFGKRTPGKKDDDKRKDIAKERSEEAPRGNEQMSKTAGDLPAKKEEGLESAGVGEVEEQVPKENMQAQEDESTKDDDERAEERHSKDAKWDEKRKGVTKEGSDEEQLGNEQMSKTAVDVSAKKKNGLESADSEEVKEQVPKENKQTQEGESTKGDNKREEARDNKDATCKEPPIQDTGSTISLDLPEVLSLGDEFSPVAGVDNEDCQQESQSLLTDLFDSEFSDGAKPQTVPGNVKFSSSYDDESTNQNPAAVEETTSGETPVEAGLAETEDCGERDSDILSLSSVDDDHCTVSTESNKSSSEDGGLSSSEELRGKLQKKRSPLSKNQKAHHALVRSLRFSGDGSTDDDSDNLPLGLKSLRIQKVTGYRRRTKHSSKKKGVEAVRKVLGSVFSLADRKELGLDDPKLCKWEPVVVLEKLAIPPDLVMKQESEVSSDDISKLLTFPQPVRKRATTPRKLKKTGATGKVSKKGKGTLGSEGSDLSLLSSEEESEEDPLLKKDPLAKTVIDATEASRQALLEVLLLDSSDNSDSGEEDDVVITPQKKHKAVPMAQVKEEAAPDYVEDEDSDEVVVNTKKKKMLKYEKLLLKRIPGSIDGSTEKETKEEQPQQRKKKTSKKRVMVSSDEDKSMPKEPKSDESSSLDTSSESESNDSDILPAPKKKKKQASSSKATSSVSDDDDFKPSKKGKRGRKVGSTSSDSGKVIKKKRRRIRVAASSDEDKDECSDDDVEILNSSQETENKSRKKIRKLISNRDVAGETRAAAKAEEERKKRVQERQKLYNEIRGSAPESANTTLQQLVLEMDVKTKEPLVVVDQDLVKCMKPHQVNGVRFMYDCTIESLEMLKKDPKKGSGCILAHCMGLGKTFQVISFLHTVMKHKVAGRILRTALIVCPYNTVLNWAQEFDHWLEDKGLSFSVHEMLLAKDNYSRVEILEYWQQEGGAMIIGYDMMRRLANEKAKGMSKHLKERLRKALIDPGPDLVICDEGHILKNAASGLSITMNKLRTYRRIVLTGTPLQNNLLEYHCMVQFVKPNLLGTKKEFTNRFVNPIANGQCADSTILDVKLMKKRVHILHRLLNGCVQRCDYHALKPFLPAKCEYVISVRLSDVQAKLYLHFLENLARGGRNNKPTQGMSLFWDFNMLRNIWTHPMLLVMSAERTAAKDLLKEENEESDSMDSFIDDASVHSVSSSHSDSNDDVQCLTKDEDKPSTSKGKGEDCNSGDEVIKTWKTRSRAARNKSSEENEEKSPSSTPEPQKNWWDQYVSEEDMEKLEISGKMSLLYNILQECDAIGDKMLLFSQSLLTLNMVEKMLEQCDERASAVNPDTAMAEPNDPMRDCHNTWVPGVDYFRMDGSTSVELRKRWIEMFNNESNLRGRLFLISTKAGSLGTNLVGANRVVLMDASWNPTHDVQAIFRVYRFGQKKPVFIYRFLAQGTMEEKIYDRQVTKQSLACRVVDEQQIERHFNAADLMELYSFNPDSKSNRPTPMVPKDRLLAEMLIRHQHWIVSYHEHDSLLQNIAEEDLTEEERKLAWEEYKEEGRRAASNAEQLLQNNASGQPQVFSLDLQKLVSDIKAKNPLMTNAELSFVLHQTLRNDQTFFKRQQMAAFEKRAEYLKLKQQVPPEILNQLTQAGAALQQLNQVLTRLQSMPHMGIPQQQGMPQQGVPQQGMPYQRMPQYQQSRRGRPPLNPQGMPQWSMPQQPTSAAAQQAAYNAAYMAAYNQALSKGATPAMAKQFAEFQQAEAWKKMLQRMGTTAHSVPVVSEADDHAPPQPQAPKPEASTVVITEISD